MADARTWSGDLEKVRNAVGFSGTLLVLLILGAPAGLTTLLGGEGAADPVNTFIAVLLFTLPLSLGIAIWAVGMGFPEMEKDQNPWIWTAVVAFGAWVLSSVLGGAAITPSEGPNVVYALPFRVLGGFLEAYGPIGFIGAFIAGGTLAYLYFTIVYPRVFGRPLS